MVAPHFHTTSEAKAAIKKIENNSGDGRTPTGIKGGSAGNATTKTEGVTSSKKGDDWVGGKGRE